MRSYTGRLCNHSAQVVPGNERRRAWRNCGRLLPAHFGNGVFALPDINTHVLTHTKKMANPLADAIRTLTLEKIDFVRPGVKKFMDHRLALSEMSGGAFLFPLLQFSKRQYIFAVKLYFILIRTGRKLGRVLKTARVAKLVYALVSLLKPSRAGDRPQVVSTT